MATDSKQTIDLEAKLAELMTLSPEQRNWLGERLIESVPLFDSPEEAQAWDEEIARRIEAHESGQDPGIPAEQVFARIEEKLRRRREGGASR